MNRGVKFDSQILFKTLGDPTRRAIYERLMAGGAQTVRALTERSGVSQPAISKHLSVLSRAGLVEGRPIGRETYYSARPQGLKPMVDWIGRYGWDQVGLEPVAGTLG